MGPGSGRGPGAATGERMVLEHVKRMVRSRPVAYRAARFGRLMWRTAGQRARAIGAPIRAALRALIGVRRERSERAEQTAAWIATGRPAPAPPAVKQRIVADHQRLNGADCLIETGTYRGDMVFAQRRRFRRIFTIELDDRLFQRAVDRFRDLGNIVVLHGDSGQVLPTLLESVRWPCLFWLDGHFSGGITARGDLETPVVLELAAILRHPIADHVILIDDARCFGQGDYPSIEALRDQVVAARPDWSLDVRDDVIRIHGPVAKRGAAAAR
jgi:hypothetical protein